MGSSGSKLVKKIFGPSSNTKESRRRPSFSSALSEEDFDGLENVVARIPPSLGSSLVMYRQGSMFFDEDGDLAHEFYVEVKEGRKSKMKRVYENLRPQGKVRLPFPRLSNDCPVILYAL